MKAEAMERKLRNVDWKETKFLPIDKENIGLSMGEKLGWIESASKAESKSISVHFRMAKMEQITSESNPKAKIDGTVQEFDKVLVTLRYQSKGNFSIQVPFN
jgi:hypothetical protein